MFEIFTERARKAMSLARQEAMRLSSEFIDTGHILLGIIQEGSGVAAKVLKNLNVDLNLIRQEIEKLITPSTSPTVTLGQFPFSPRAKRVIELADEAGSQLGHDVIGTEHLLLGLIMEKEGNAAKTLRNLGLNLDEVRDMVVKVLDSDTGGDDSWQHPSPNLSPQHERNLTALSQLASYRHVVDRPSLQDSIVKLLQLGRSIALVGPEFVGKTSLVLTLARSCAGGIRYWSIDYRIFDEFCQWEVSNLDGPNIVRFVAEGESFVTSRKSCGEFLAHRMKRGERLILEFREDGLEKFAARYPHLATDLVRVTVPPPDSEECGQLLESGLSRLTRITGLKISDDVLQEADRRAAERLPGMIAPWGTMLAFWEAVPIELKGMVQEECRLLDEEIKTLEKLKDEAIRLHHFEKAATARDQALQMLAQRRKLYAEKRCTGDKDLSIESIRLAIDNLVAEAGSP